MELDSITIAITTNTIAIITVGVSLAGLILRQGARMDALQAELTGLRNHMERRFDALEAQMTERTTALRIDALREQNRCLQERVAWLEGRLAGRSGGLGHRVRDK